MALLPNLYPPWAGARPGVELKGRRGLFPSGPGHFLSGTEAGAREEGGRQDQLQKQERELALSLTLCRQETGSETGWLGTLPGCTGPTPDSQAKKLGYKEGRGKRNWKYWGWGLQAVQPLRTLFPQLVMLVR